MNSDVAVQLFQSSASNVAMSPYCLLDSLLTNGKGGYIPEPHWGIESEFTKYDARYHYGVDVCKYAYNFDLSGDNAYWFMSGYICKGNSLDYTDVMPHLTCPVDGEPSGALFLTSLAVEANGAGVTYHKEVDGKRLYRTCFDDEGISLYLYEGDTLDLDICRPFTSDVTASLEFFEVKAFSDIHSFLDGSENVGSLVHTALIRYDGDGLVVNSQTWRGDFDVKPVAKTISADKCPWYIIVKEDVTGNILFIGRD